MVTSVGLPPNPFRPGAGHMPPHLAGREQEKREFERAFGSAPYPSERRLDWPEGCRENSLAGGAEAYGHRSGWSWVGADLSESTSVSGRQSGDCLSRICHRHLSVAVKGKEGRPDSPRDEEQTLDFSALMRMYADAPGLTVDKLEDGAGDHLVAPQSPWPPGVILRLRRGPEHG